MIVVVQDMKQHITTNSAVQMHYMTAHVQDTQQRIIINSVQ